MMVTRIKRNFKKIIKFGAVGGCGTFVNMTIFTLAVQWLQINHNIAALIAFMVAVTQNYIFNHLWTFRIENRSIPLNFRYYLSYIAGNLIGLLCNLVVLNLLIGILGRNYTQIAQCVGIIIGMGLNFIFAKKIVFIRKELQHA